MSDSGAQRRRGAGATAAAWAKELAIVVVGALIASTLLRLFLLQMFVIPSGSMENTLLVKDRVAVQKVIPHQRGDIIVFRDELGWLGPPKVEADPVKLGLIFLGLAPDESANHLIKRVIGVAGDRVTCCDAQGRISVNGVALNEGAYLYADPTTGIQVDPSVDTFDITVPEGTVFVLGDHRNASQDSRCHLDDPADVPGSQAFIPTTEIVGTAVAVVYPFDRIRGLTRPVVFEEVPAGGDPPAAPVVKDTDILC